MRLDSGNLVELSREVRKILDDAGLGDAKIMASSDLNEYKIRDFVRRRRAHRRCSAWGPIWPPRPTRRAMAAAYKLVELESGHQALHREIQRRQSLLSRAPSRCSAMWLAT